MSASSPPSTAGQVWLESTSSSGVTLTRSGDTPENRIWGSGQPLQPSPFRPAYDASRTRSNDQQLRSAQYIELPSHATRNAVSSARPPWPHVGASTLALFPGVPMYHEQPTAALGVLASHIVTPPLPTPRLYGRFWRELFLPLIDALTVVAPSRGWWSHGQLPTLAWQIARPVRPFPLCLFPLSRCLLPGLGSLASMITPSLPGP